MLDFISVTFINEKIKDICAENGKINRAAVGNRKKYPLRRTGQAFIFFREYLGRTDFFDQDRPATLYRKSFFWAVIFLFILSNLFLSKKWAHPPHLWKTLNMLYQAHHLKNIEVNFFLSLVETEQAFMFLCFLHDACKKLTTRFVLIKIEHLQKFTIEVFHTFSKKLFTGFCSEANGSHIIDVSFWKHDSDAMWPDFAKIMKNYAFFCPCPPFVVRYGFIKLLDKHCFNAPWRFFQTLRRPPKTFSSALFPIPCQRFFADSRSPKGFPRFLHYELLFQSFRWKLPDVSSSALTLT